MRRVGRATWLAAASTLLLVRTACSDLNEPGNGPTATPTTASATPTVRPTTPLRLLRSVATSVKLDGQQRLIQNERSEGLVQTGQPRVAELVVESVDLDNCDQKAGLVPTAQVDICLGVSEVDVVDQDGKSTIRDSRALPRGVESERGLRAWEAAEP
jgi:hypothetical protein